MLGYQSPFGAPQRSTGGGPVLRPTPGPGFGNDMMFGGGQPPWMGQNGIRTSGPAGPQGGPATPPWLGQNGLDLSGPGGPQARSGTANQQQGPAWQPQGPSNNPTSSQMGPASQFPMTGTVNSSITPTGVYTQRQTNAAANQAESEAMRSSSLPSLLKQLDRPGVSRSAGSVAAVMPQMAASQQQGMFDAAQIRQQDELANRQSMFGGQVAQDQEGLGLMNILRQLYGIGQQQDTRNLNMGLGMMGSFF